MSNRQPLPLIIGIILAFHLSGCNDQSSPKSLMQSLEDIRNRPSGQIESLPERPSFPVVRYTGSDLRSPFRLEEESGDTGQRHLSEQFKPDTSRVKGALEHHPLETLTLVGTIQFADAQYPTALIDDGQGKVHQVKKGAYLGQDFGRVAEITADTVYIEETVQDEQGGWITRSKQLNLAKNN